jgi:LacI family transcriptional regulator
MKNPTLREIAKACGVNVSTVSRALNNKRKIPPETREAILQRAKKLGWKPNALASAYMAHLRSTRTPSHQGNLAFLIATKLFRKLDELPEYQRQVLAGAKQSALAQGFALETVWLRELNYDMRRLSRMLKNRGIAGVVVHAGDLTDEDFEPFEWDAFALATWGFSLQKPQLHRAAYHAAHGMRTALQRIREAGYTRIGLSMEEQMNNLADHAGVSCFYEGSDLREAADLVKLYHGRTYAVQQDIQFWIRKYKPEVVIGDELVWHAVQAVGEKGYKAAFVSLHWSARWPDVAGIDHLPQVIGSNVVDLLTAQIFRNESGIPQRPKLLLNEGEWRDGPSMPRRDADVSVQPSHPRRSQALLAGSGKS